MGASNSWAEFAGVFRSTRSAFLEHERAKAELKGLMPEDAKEAIGHGVRAKRSQCLAAARRYERPTKAYRVGSEACGVGMIELMMLPHGSAQNAVSR